MMSFGAPPPHSKQARSIAHARTLRLAAERHGLRKSEYLAKVGLTLEQWLAGERPAGYAEEVAKSRIAKNRRK